VQGILISAFVGATLTACSAPPAPKDPVDISIEPTAEEDDDAPPGEDGEPAPPEQDPEQLEALGGLSVDDIGDSVSAEGLPTRGVSSSGAGIGALQGPGIRGGTVGRLRTGSGSGHSSVIRRVIRGQSQRVKQCYEQSLKRDGPGVQGKLVVKFTIAPDGSVSAAKADPGLSSTLDACVVGAIRGATFPAPPNGQPSRVSYPFIFTPAP